ncbi:MAG TPA: hypothetical protein VFX96_17455 [Pyrinomonadaceae bacterium]|nr:hypothetical protein [Pyrinomonadaceae bacterium]
MNSETITPEVVAAHNLKPEEFERRRAPLGRHLPPVFGVTRPDQLADTLGFLLTLVGG